MRALATACGSASARKKRSTGCSRNCRRSSRRFQKRRAGDKGGILRFGDATLPPDEVLVTAAIDLSDRAFFGWKADVPRETLGNFNTELAEEFWRAVASCGAFNLHIMLHHGRNTHHVIEGIFKATARALRSAIEPDPRGTGVPSTKGSL